MVVNTVFSASGARQSPVRAPVRIVPRSASGGVVVMPMASNVVQSRNETQSLRRAADEARRELAETKKALRVAQGEVAALRDAVRELDEDCRAKDVRIEELTKRLAARNRKRSKKEDTDEEAPKADH